MLRFFITASLSAALLLMGRATCFGGSPVDNGPSAASASSVANSLCAQDSDAQFIEQLMIIVTPVGGGSTYYTYTKESFSVELKRNLHIFQPISISSPRAHEGSAQQYLINIKVGTNDYNFKVSDRSPIIRFDFDRGRRKLIAKGLNALSDSTQVVTQPSYKGVALNELWALWKEQIERNMDDRYLFEKESAKRLILEIEIDEDGFVHDIQELGGTLKSYSQSCIKTIYDIAAREWQPAQINGKKVRTRAIVILGDAPGV